MSNVIIREFASSDRGSIRQICCDTADRGEAIEGFFHDRELAADLLIKYYTDYEPSSTFVADSGGRVVAYVQASLDNRRYGLVMCWVIIPQSLMKAFKNGTFFHREFWRLVAAMAQNLRRLFYWRKESFNSHQAHMHIGIAKDFRGQGIGQRLAVMLIDHARARGAGELTASVHDGNAGARRFFESLGFTVRESYPMVMARAGEMEQYHSLLYVKTII